MKLGNRTLFASKKKSRFKILGLILVMLTMMVMGMNLPSFEVMDCYASSDYSGPRARADYEFTIICENVTHVTNGGDPTGYFIEITNTGSRQDTILLTAKIINVTGGDEPDINEWHTRLDKDLVNLGAGQSEIVILTVETGCGCQDGTTATVRIAGESSNEPSMTAYVDTYTIRGPVIGEQLVDFDIEDVSVFFSLTAGQDLTFNLVVYNLQTVSQSYYIINTIKPLDWVLEYNQAPFEVAKNSKKVIPIHTGIPLKNEPGEYMFRFDVRSDRDPTISGSTQVPIALLPELTVDEINVTPREPYLNNPVALRITIKNLGQAVARNFVLNLYNTTVNVLDLGRNLINSTKIKELYGNETVVVNFTWFPQELKAYNITLFVNPGNPIPEFSNRYGNNLKTKKITVQEQPQDKPVGDGDRDGSSWLGVGILVIIILLVVFFMKKSRKFSHNDVRTAQKIPLSRELSLGGKGSRFGAGRGKKGKKAHKEKLTAADRARMRGRDIRQRRNK
ncbi:CARDB domain-containing protein [[Eubacterium] cellulosolvens]